MYRWIGSNKTSYWHMSFFTPCIPTIPNMHDKDDKTNLVFNSTPVHNGLLSRLEIIKLFYFCFRKTTLKFGYSENAT